MVRVRFHIVGNARIKNVGKYQSCMACKLRIIFREAMAHTFNNRDITHAVSTVMMAAPDFFLARTEHGVGTAAGAVGHTSKAMVEGASQAVDRVGSGFNDAVTSIDQVIDLGSSVIKKGFKSSAKPKKSSPAATAVATTTTTTNASSAAAVVAEDAGGAGGRGRGGSSAIPGNNKKARQGQGHGGLSESLLAAPE